MPNYQFNYLWSGYNAHVLARQGPDCAFVLAVEANSKDSRAHEPGVIQSLVESVALRSPVELLSRDAPRTVGLAIDAALRANGDSDALCTLLYASAFITRHRIDLCTAGDIRVHALEGSSVYMVSKDHSLYADLPESDRWRATGDAKKTLEATVSRSLGALSSTPAACEAWELRERSSFLVCSSSFHRYADPELYANSLMNFPPAHDVLNSYSTGLLVVVCGT